MPNPYPIAKEELTKTCRDLLAIRGLTSADLRYVISNYGIRTDGRNPGQLWYQGETAEGRYLKVLVESHSQYVYKVITFFESS